ncbi:hypothetical protein Emed_004264 [Eimeria media]
MATEAESVTEMACEVGSDPEDQGLTLWERILDELDRRQALLKGSLYSALFIAFLYFRTGLSEHKDCIRLQLDRVDLIAGQLPAVRDCFEGEDQEGHPRYGRVRAARKPPEDIHDKTAADVLRTLLVGRRVVFTPVEAGLGVIRANVSMRTLWWADDIAEYLVARGLATTNHNSFSPQRALNTTSLIRSWESQRAYNRLMDLEKSAIAQRVGMWSNPQMQQQQLRVRMSVPCAKFPRVLEHWRMFMPKFWPR